MSVMRAILRRELGAYFNTPIGYVFVVCFLWLSCAFYVSRLFAQGLAEMREFFGLLPLLFLFFVPLISMRLWAEERKLGTLELLMTFPVKTWEAVLAKFLAGMAFLILTLALTLHLPVTLYVLAPPNSPGPDFGPIIGGYLGALVLGTVYLSIGAFASSLTSDQIIASVIGILICFLFFLMGYQPMLDWIRNVIGPGVAGHVERFGVNYHFESISRGVLDTRDLIYAATVTAFFLFLNALVLERRR
jgi:ABC-2 type transport system permease protein